MSSHLRHHSQNLLPRFLLSYCLLLSNFLFHHLAPRTSLLYTLSLHDALPISICLFITSPTHLAGDEKRVVTGRMRSEEHTSELQSRGHLVCRLLPEKKKI